MSTKQEIAGLANLLEQSTNGEYALVTWAPGDGVTRYSIGRKRSKSDRHDFYSDERVVTALGAKEALVMLRAFLAGRDSL